MTAQPLPPPDADSNEIDFLDFLQTIAENLRLLVVVPIAVGLLALGISFLVTPTFTATTVFLPPQQQQNAAALLLQNLGALGGIAGAAAGLKNPNDQFVAILKSRTVQDKLIERFKLKERYDEELMYYTRKALEDNVRIGSGKDGLITVDVDDYDGAFAAQMANAHVDELAILMQRLALTEAQQRRVFFEGQLLGTKEKLVKAELALAASGVSSSTLKSNPLTAVEAVARVQAEIAASEIRISSLRSYLAESAPAMKQALAELLALRAQLKGLEQAGGGASEGNAEYVSRFRDFKYYETLFELFAKQFELAKIDEARDGAAIQVVDIALPPDKKSSPKRALIAILAILATGFALLLFAFTRKNLLSGGRAVDTANKLAKLRSTILSSIKSRTG